MPTRNDIPHYTPEDVEHVLTSALAFVDVIAPPDDLRVAVFTQAATMLGAKTIQLAQPQHVPFSIENLRGQAL